MENPRSKLLARIGDVNDFSRPRPLVTLEEFFEGNNDYASIGYNFYPGQPSPHEFYELFKSIRNRADVYTVVVQVQQQEDPDAWPSTDTIWVVTSVGPQEIYDWLGPKFQPDDLFEGLSENTERIHIPDGQKAYGVWYD